MLVPASAHPPSQGSRASTGGACGYNGAGLVRARQHARAASARCTCRRRCSIGSLPTATVQPARGRLAAARRRAVGVAERQQGVRSGPSRNRHGRGVTDSRHEGTAAVTCSQWTRMARASPRRSRATRHRARWHTRPFGTWQRCESRLASAGLMRPTAGRALAPQDSCFERSICALAFSSDGALLLCGHEQRTAHAVRI